jgi:hypothetical protein
MAIVVAFCISIVTKALRSQSPAITMAMKWHHCVLAPSSAFNTLSCSPTMDDY